MEGFVHVRLAHDGGEERVQAGEQAGVHSGDDQHGRVVETRVGAMLAFGRAEADTGARHLRD